MVLAHRFDAELGRTERLEFIEGERGAIYTWISYPQDVHDVVVVCSPICADFSANYHRERLLGRALLDRNVGVARFHYRGEGNSDGDAAAMTFQSLCEDAEAVTRHVEQVVDPTGFAYLGTRASALVAASMAASRPGAPLVLWEPVLEPLRFYREAYRAKRASSVAADRSLPASTFFEELERDGVVDVLGYNLYPALVESLDGLDLRSVIAGHDGPRYLVWFTEKKGASHRLGDGVEGDSTTSTETFSVAGSWWFHDETVVGADELVDATAGWLSTVLGGADDES